MERKRLSPEEQIRLRQQIVQVASESESWMEVARKLGWSYSKLAYWRQVLEIERDAIKTPISREELEQAFRSGKTVAMVSKETGIPYARIKRLAQRWGLPMPTPRKARMWLRGRNRKELGLEIHRLFEAGKSMTEIANELEVPYSVVYYELVTKKALHARA